MTGKLIVFGFDTSGRPATYMLPSRQNTDEATRQLQYTVWVLERCIDLMGPGVETYVVFAIMCFRDCEWILISATD